MEALLCIILLLVLFAKADIAGRGGASPAVFDGRIDRSQDSLLAVFMLLPSISSLASSAADGGNDVNAVIVISPSSSGKDSLGREDQAPSLAASKAISGESSQAWILLFLLSISLLPEVVAEKPKSRGGKGGRASCSIGGRTALLAVNAFIEFIEGNEECKLEREEGRSFSVPARGLADVDVVLVEGEGPPTRFKPTLPEAAVAERGLVTPKPVVAAAGGAFAVVVVVALVLMGVRGNFHPLCSFCFSG